MHQAVRNLWGRRLRHGYLLVCGFYRIAKPSFTVAIFPIIKIYQPLILYFGGENPIFLVNYKRVGFSKKIAQRSVATTFSEIPVQCTNHGDKDTWQAAATRKIP